MLIMRVYMLYERSRRVLAVLVGMSLTVTSFGCVRLRSSTYDWISWSFPFKKWSVLGAVNQTPDMDPVLPVRCAASLTCSQLVLNISASRSWATLTAFSNCRGIRRSNRVRRWIEDHNLFCLELELRGEACYVFDSVIFVMTVLKSVPFRSKSGTASQLWTPYWCHFSWYSPFVLLL